MSECVRRSENERGAGRKVEEGDGESSLGLSEDYTVGSYLDITWTSYQVAVSGAFRQL